MKRSFSLIVCILACMIPAMYSVSCNSFEGNIEQTPVESQMINISNEDSGSFEHLLKKNDSVLVCNSKTAYAYHSSYCSGLNRCKASISKILKSDAEAQGRNPCKFCY